MKIREIGYVSLFKLVKRSESSKYDILFVLNVSFFKKLTFLSKK